MPRRHTRAILAVHGIGWWILDHILGTGAASVDCFWHVHPSWRLALDRANVCRLDAAGTTLALASTAPLTVLPPGSDLLALRSPAYGVLEPAPVVRGSDRPALPATIASFIPAAAELADGIALERSAIVSDPGGGWHAAAFRARWRRGAMTLLCAIETGGVANRDTSAPATPWGTAELQTDARCALVIDRNAGPSEAILVNGALVTGHPAHQLASLASRVPLLRLQSRTLAPSMHEVAQGSPDV
jgi:hypothetical protein